MSSKRTPKTSIETPDGVVEGHPLRDAIDRARQIIREAVPEATESVKWNAPSFATSEHFATFFLRAKTGFQVVLHLGSKSRTDSPARAQLRDPAGLLDWRGPDRAIITFHDVADVTARRAAFSEILQQWVTFV